jgi:uncharacterized protein
MAALYKLIVTGAFNAGKTTFVQTLSDMAVVNTDKTTFHRQEAKVKSSTTVALDYGQVRLAGGNIVHLFGTPGQARFDFMHDLLADGMHGFIFLIDITDRQTLPQANTLLHQFRKRSRVPYLLVANKADRRGLSLAEIKKLFKLPPGQPVVSCIATNKHSVKAVVEQLVLMIEGGA